MKLKGEVRKPPASAQLSVRAIVIENRKVLMVQHEHLDKRGVFWVFPGGGVEKGETTIEAAIRETIEETGITVKPLGIVHLREAETEGERGFEVYFVCEKISGEVTRGYDPEDPFGEGIKDTRWISSSELNQIVFYPETLRELLPQWVDNDNVPMMPLPEYKVIER